MKEIFDKEAKAIADELKINFAKSGIKATGKTIESIRPVSDELGFKIYAAEEIDQVLHGSGPGTVVDVDKIKAWIDSKNLKLNPDGVAARIKAVGTRLWRGDDPQYPGKKTREFAVTDVLTTARLKDIGLAVGAKYALDIQSEVIRQLKAV